MALPSPYGACIDENVVRLASDHLVYYDQSKVQYPGEL
jgi:hypothetical protein